MKLSVFQSGASATPPAPPTSPSTGYPTNENKSTNTPPTTPGDYWFYQMLAEHEALLAEAGITPLHTNLTQMRDAIKAIIAARSQDSRNLLIGGNFSTNPWQQGTSTTVTVSGTYVSDMHRVDFDGTANISAEKVAIPPQVINGVTCHSALRLTINSKSGNTYMRLSQRCENVARAADAALYLQCAVQGSAAYSVPVQLRQNFGVGGSPSADVVTPFAASLAVTASMQLLASGVTAPSITAKTVGTTGLHTSYSAVEYDLMNVPVSGTITIPIHDLRRSALAAPFEYRSAGDVLRECQRYYCTDAANGFVWQGTTSIGGSYGVRTSFPVTMRAAPAVTATIDAATGFSTGAATASNITASGFTVAPTATASANAQFYRGTFVARAEL